MKKRILISVEIDTNKDLSEIQSAVTKGLCYGLDVKRVAPPKDINIISCEEEMDMNKFWDWWLKDKGFEKAEAKFGKRASEIADRIDPKCELVNIYSDLLEKFAIRSKLNLQ